MKIAVVASNGRAAQYIIAEALARGHEVTAFSRGAENKSAAKTYVQKEILDLTKEDLAGFDVVVDGFGAYQPDELHLHVKTSQHLCDLLSGTPTRLFVVGGAGSLYANEEQTLQLLETPDFPEIYLPLATAQANELAEMRKRSDVNWVFVSPAMAFIADGVKTGKYLQAGEVFTTNSKGESIISYADYAVALVDEIEAAKYVKARISFLQA